MKKSVCLNMIVKNESAVIERCLTSVKKLIDYWVIVDTGSSDGTLEIIRRVMKDIPGELWERPWVDFAHNRNEAFALAKNHGDYLLLIDADERLQFDDSFQSLLLEKDVYAVGIRTVTSMIYFRHLLIKSQLDWWWVGVVHETLMTPQVPTVVFLEDVLSIASQEGGRSQDPEKFLKDAQVLEKALETDPNNSRYVFYLAISYGNARELTKALKNHEKRVAMGGESSETFYSLLTIAELQEDLNMESDIFIKSYCNAFEFRPTRLEPLSYIARYYIKMECYFIGYLVTKYALAQPLTFETAFIRFSVYTHELLVQFAECAFQIGRSDECYRALKELQKKDQLPSELRERIETLLKDH